MASASFFLLQHFPPFAYNNNRTMSDAIQTQEPGCLKGHDRYLIYHMIGRKISFRNNGSRRTGTVESVTRDIFSNAVEITVNGNKHTFSEPVAIVMDGENIVFIYGDTDFFDTSDEALFDEMRNCRIGETIDDILHKTKRNQIKRVRFAISDEKVKRKRSWKRKS